MTVILPTKPAARVSEPYFLDMGGWQQGRGGDAVRLDQLGDRHGVVVRLPPMKFNDPDTQRHGRLWISRLKRGMSEGARVRFVQPDYTPPLTSANLTTTAAQATLVAISGATPNVVIPEGIGCTIIKAATGRRYFHTVSADLNTGAGGAGNLSIHPRTRVSLVPGDTVSFAPLEIEGRIVGEEQRWTFDELRTVGIEFQIEEIS